MKILRIHEVINRTGLSRTTIWRLESKGMFPQKIKLSVNSVGWFEKEIHEWLQSRPRVVNEKRKSD